MKYRSSSNTAASAANTKPRPVGQLLSLACALGLLGSGFCTPAHALYEEPPILKASELLPPDWLHGTHYFIQPQVPTDGFLTQVTIKSDYGVFHTQGPGILGIRLREIDALAALDRLEEGGQFVSGVTDSAGDTGSNLRQLFEEPGTTLAGIPKGIQRFFQRSARTAKTAQQKRENAQEPVTSEAASDIPGGDQITAHKDSKGADGDTSIAAANALGFDESRRQLAKRLGVDPYTTNPVLAERLNEVAWAAFAGQVSVRVATMFVPGGLILSTSNRLTELVWDSRPGDLQLEIEQTLREIGVDQASIDQLLSHRWYSLSMQTAVAWALKKLEGVNGRANVMPLVLDVSSEAQARFVVQSLLMTGRAHHMLSPLREVKVAWTLVATDVAGDTLVAAPVDYLSWNPRLEAFVKRFPPGTVRRRLHVAGVITAFARLKLEEHGWEVVENSNLFVPLLGYSMQASNDAATSR